MELRETPLKRFNQLLTVAVQEPPPESYVEGLHKIMGGSKHFRMLTEGLFKAAITSSHSSPNRSATGAAIIAFELGWKCRDIMDREEGEFAKLAVIPIMLVSPAQLDDLLEEACKFPESESDAMALFKLGADSKALRAVLAPAREQCEFSDDPTTLHAFISAFLAFLSLGWRCRDNVASQFPEWTDFVRNDRQRCTEKP